MNVVNNFLKTKPRFVIYLPYSHVSPVKGSLQEHLHVPVSKVPPLLHFIPLHGATIKMKLTISGNCLHRNVFYMFSRTEFTIRVYLSGEYDLR